jgi:hypothetical protein
MEIEMSVGSELAGLKVTLSEFTAIVKHISGEAKHQDAKQALKEMIEEVRKSYDTAVDVFTPMYGLDTERKFSGQFSQVRMNFKNRYLKDIGNVRTHCSIVTDKLEDLKKRKSWTKGLPYIKRSFVRLESLAKDWISNDARLATGMENFLKGVNKILDAVNKIQGRNNSEAFRYLRSSLEQFEDDLVAIKNRLNELSVVSAKL